MTSAFLATFATLINQFQQCGVQRLELARIGGPWPDLLTITMEQIHGETLF